MMGLAARSEAAPAASGQPRTGYHSIIPTVLSILAVIVLIDLYVVWFVNAERTLYHADQVTYWSYSSNLSKLAGERPFSAVRAVAQTVAYQDLNLLPAVPIAGVLALAGDSRLAYVLAVINVYGLAAVLALVFALWRLGGPPKPWVVPATLLILPTMWRAIFIGYLGIGGVAIALLVLALAWDFRETPPSSRKLAVAGLLLALLVVFRRWWLIWVAAFLLVTAVDALWCFLRSRTNGWQRLRDSFLGPLILASSAAAAILVLSAPIMVQRLTMNYSDRFTIWRLDSVTERVGAVVGQFGVAGLLLVSLSVAVLLKSDRMRRLAILLSLQTVTTYVIMTRIQDHSPQHWYLYYPQALLLVGLAAGRVIETLPKRWRTFALGGTVAAGVAMTTVVFVPAATSWTRGLGALLPTDRIQPATRGDLAEIDRLLGYLDTSMKAHPGRVYVLASGPYLSDQVLAFANLSLNTDYRSPLTIVSGSHVDRRDGFPRGLLVADYVLVPDPPVVPERPEEQRVVVEPAMSFHRHTDVALAFRRLPQTFQLDNGLRVLVFERFRAHTREEVEALSRRLRAAYPDRPEIYSP